METTLAYHDQRESAFSLFSDFNLRLIDTLVLYMQIMVIMAGWGILLHS